MRQGPRSEPTAFTRAVVEILNEAMTTQAMSKHRLAQAVDDSVSRSQLYDILNGVRTMDLGETEAIAEALGLRVGDVVADAYRRSRASGATRRKGRSA